MHFENKANSYMFVDICKSWLILVLVYDDKYDKYFKLVSRVTYEVSNLSQKVSVMDNNLRYLPFLYALAMYCQTSMGLFILSNFKLV